jgi:hypothetical protein
VRLVVFIHPMQVVALAAQAFAAMGDAKLAQLPGIEVRGLG